MTNIRALLVTSLAALASCLPPAMIPPAPLGLQSTKSPTEAVQAATRELAAAGYDIAVSDAGAGTVIALRKGTPENFGPYLECRMAKGSMGSRMGETTLRVSVSARAATNGSEVQIASHAVTSYAKTIGPFSSTPDSETDCVSSGAIEKRIAGALGK